jgi:hypothetical protein
VKRFIRVLGLVAVLAAVLAAGAYALAFSDNDYFWPDGTVGEPYLKELHPRSDCPPFKFDLLAGELPPGLELESRGVVDGTPTQLGTYNFWLRVRDCLNMSAEREFTIKVTRIRLQVTTSRLAVAVRNTAYSQALATQGGAGAKRWTLAAGALPTGLTLGADGTITGTATATGDFVFTVSVADDGPSTDTKQLLIRVVDPLAIAPLPTRAHVAEVGKEFSARLAGTGGTQPYAWAVTGGLPAGLTLDGATGDIAGVPETPGNVGLSITLTDANGLVQALPVRFVVAGRLTLLTTRLAAAAVGRAYSARLAVRGGIRPLRFAAIAGRLPRGIRLAERTGVLAGTATAAGTFRVRVRVTDFLGVTATRPLVLAVGA